MERENVSDTPQAPTARPAHDATADAATEATTIRPTEPAPRASFFARAGSALRRFLTGRALRASLFAFVLTRFIILLVFVLVTHTRVAEPHRPGEAVTLYVTVDSSTIDTKLAELATRGDAAWYATVVTGGYEQTAFTAEGQHNWAYFPLHPLLWRAAWKLTGEVGMTGIALANVLFLFALVLLHRLTNAFGFGDDVADRAVFYVAAFPVSYFFSLPWTESLFLVLTAGCVLAARCDRWWVAGLLGALASATRFNGLLLAPVLALLYLLRYGARPRVNALSILLVPAGLALFMLHLHEVTGNALAFKDALAAWGRVPGYFWQPLWQGFTHFHEVGHSWNFQLLNFAAALTGLACGFVLLKRREWVLALYNFLFVLVPLSTTNLTSHARYVMVVFPVFVALAAVAEGRPRFDQTVRALFLSLLGIMAAMFAYNITLAGA